MAIGDISIKTCKIGNIDLTKYKDGSLAGFNIYEDILNPYGPVCEIRVIDHSDSLGQKKFTGAYDQNIELEFSGDTNVLSTGKKIKYKLKPFHNKNLDDMSMSNEGAGRHKQYDVRCVSEEFLNAQGNYIQKAWDDKTSKMVEDVLKDGFKTKKKIDIQEKTKGKKKFRIDNKHPLEALNMLNQEHVAEESKSSAFVLFQQPDQDEHKYVFGTFEKLFQQQPVVKLKQTTNLDYEGVTEKDKQNSLLWFKPSDNFFAPTRSLSKSSEYTYNHTTHRISTVEPKQNQFKYAEQEGWYGKQAEYSKEVPVHTINDKANYKDKHETATARTNRAQYLSHLSQDSAEFETYYNPDIKIGSMIGLEIPLKANQEQEKGEQFFNGNCLVVALRTKYRIDKRPYCTMVCRVIKASPKKNGGGNA